MNVHHGKIGDIWKHLPLAEILSIEKPTRYWDSHAGSAEYPLTHSWERDYGVFHFLENAGQSADLCNSAFFRVLLGLQSGKANLCVYPGSPGLAMTLLAQSAEYLFCNTDVRSIDSIRLVARTRGLSEARARCVLGDGVVTVQKALSELPARGLGKLFLHIDPYNPLERGEGRQHAADLFFEAASKGVRTMLWYGWDTNGTHDHIWAQLAESFHSLKFTESVSYWCGEISLVEAPNPDPGVAGCGILCGNLSDASILACTRLGNSLATVYQDATLPGNRSGAIDFHTVEPCNS
ncbi:MAG TPA: 23S rRNA (adenine(2030)-N(6))-methyltransferase RlmJ [Sedimentisphaerales bacterium]|jgi:23S rRNA (adenine2030-N6)-methyltransferase|nr:23S rRNA (adenine(2030)-N(6))-methyltransferase RlmJ [Sedimentisphaerales bacterium]HNU30820.1 23S rRNA (adenine(2030)-N(6))-methyltransferase RlmJ [Sedimentisphaerales bacterium]